jgi:hypothetical protein
MSDAIAGIKAHGDASKRTSRGKSAEAQKHRKCRVEWEIVTFAGLSRLKSRAFLEGLYRRIFFLLSLPSVAQASNEILRLMPEGELN